MGLESTDGSGPSKLEEAVAEEYGPEQHIEDLQPDFLFFGQGTGYGALVHKLCQKVVAVREQADSNGIVRAAGFHQCRLESHGVGGAGVG